MIVTCDINPWISGRELLYHDVYDVYVYLCDLLGKWNSTLKETHITRVTCTHVYHVCVCEKKYTSGK